MGNNPPPLFELSSRYTAPAQVTDEVYAAKRKAKRNADRFQIPKGYSIVHTGTGITRNGDIQDPLFISLLKRDSDGYNAGSIHWDSRTGHVRGFYMDPDMSNYASNLLTAAHDHAAKEGVDGPTNSNEMTDYSYNMAKRLVPSSIPKNSTVSGAPIQFRQEEFLRKLHEVHSHAHLLEAVGGQMHPALARLSVDERPSAHLGAALDAHHTGFHAEMGEHFENAKEAAVTLMDNIDQIDHPHSQMLKDKWNGLLNTMSENRMRY